MTKEQTNFIFRDYAVSIRPYIYTEDGYETTKFHAYAVQKRFEHLFDEIIDAHKFGNDDHVLKVLKDNGYNVLPIEDCEDCYELKTDHPMDEAAICYVYDGPQSDTFMDIVIEEEDWICPHAMTFQICREIDSYS
jgi:hypothetical protein